jgi:putative DNA primase/helicase
MAANAFAPLGDAAGNDAGAGASPPMQDWIPEIPAPDEPPAAPRHQKHGTPSATWVYRDAEGRPLFMVARFDVPGGKEVLPLTFGTLRGRGGWHWRAPPDPRALYGLPDLAARPDAPVLMVEGEKTADAARALFQDYVAMTWPGGSNATKRADWSALVGRRVIIWPDHDTPGRNAAAAVYAGLLKAGAASVAMVDVPDTFPARWDVADPLPAGSSVYILRDMLANAEREAARAASLPPGFRLSREGLFFAPPDDVEATPLHVCGPLRVLAATNDGTGNAWGVLLQWEDGDGRRHEWAMPRAMLAGDGADVRARLLDAGLFLNPSRRARDKLGEYLARATPPERALVVPRIGWHGAPGARCFVLPDGALGEGAVNRVMLQTERPDALPPLAQSGTLTNWQREIAAPAEGNSRLVLALCAAFAAPLLALVNGEGGGLHLRGHSSCGKSTALSVAGSVWGGGGLRGWVRSWRTTDNALEAVAAAHCDLLLCLDEMGEAAGEAVAASAYALANGAGKGRAARDGSARRVAEWRILFLSTGEEGLAERLAEARGGPRRVRAGQEVRVLDIPADTGLFGLFEDLRRFTSAASFADHLKAASTHYYGTAGREWLKNLADDPEGMGQAAREIIDAWRAVHVQEDVAGQVGRAASRFAVLAAAGALATRFGILPWGRGEAEGAVGACFEAWRGARRGGDGAAEDAQAVAMVRRFIALHGSSRFEGAGGSGDGMQRTINRAGWVKTDIDDARRYLILPEIWHDEVVPGLDPETAARALHRAGFLMPGTEGGRLTRKERVPGLANPARVYAVRESILEGDGA